MAGKCQHCGDDLYGNFDHCVGCGKALGVEQRIDATGWAQACYNMMSVAWEMAENHGFHDGYEFGTKIALMHSELSEVLEADRHGNPKSEKIPDFSHVEEEFADLVIRVMDECRARSFDLPGAVRAKMIHNASRPFKHGKKY